MGLDATNEVPCGLRCGSAVTSIKKLAPDEAKCLNWCNAASRRALVARRMSVGPSTRAGMKPLLGRLSVGGVMPAR